MNEENGSLKTGIVLVFIANLINLVISLVNGFVLPKYLSVETYADIKTYQLYANYIGIIALGYTDGLYLKYGGKKIGDITVGEVNTVRGNLLAFQGIMTAAAIILSIIIGDNILLITSISILPVNIASTFKNIFQATGEFKSYSRIINYTSILTFLGSMVLLFVVKSDNALFYIAWTVAVTFVVWALLELKLKTGYGYKTGVSFSLSDIVSNIKSGFVLMLGNFSSILMTSIDRWFVKFLLTVQDFAYYSFVVSVEHLINVFITPVVTTMYNYICTSHDYARLKQIKKICMLAALILIAGAFPVKFVLEVYLTKYLPSKNVLFILFSTEVLYMVIKGIYVNIYKARKQQNVYFKQLVGIIVLGCVLNTIAYLLVGSIESIAFATLLSVVCWYVICSFTVKEIRPDAREIIVLVVCLAAYLAAGMFMNTIVGLVVYMAVFAVMSLVFMRNEIKELFAIGISFVKSKR